MNNGKLFKELLDKAVDENVNISIPGTDKSIDLKYINDAVETIKSVMVTDASKRPALKLDMKETLYSADASVLIPKVISDVLMRPLEPMMIGQKTLARTVTIDTDMKSVEFPTLGALRAGDIAQGQEYPEMNLAFGEATTEIKVTKSGLKCSIAEEVVNNSMWDVLALHVEAMGYAMMRWKEEKIFKAFEDTAIVAFDNSNSDTAYHTTGTYTDLNKNGTLAFNDLIDAMGMLLANEYAPTDIVLHPMAWTIFMKDPRLQFQLLTHGPVGQTYGPIGPDNIAQNLPWSMNVNVTPFVAYSTNTHLTNLAATGDDTGPCTSIYICDRNNGIILLQREGLQPDQFNDPSRDILYLKVKEMYGVGLPNGGRSAVVLKNVRIAENFAPMYTVRTKSL
jgi:hypothetical protein